MLFGAARMFISARRLLSVVFVSSQANTNPKLSKTVKLPWKCQATADFQNTDTTLEVVSLSPEVVLYEHECCETLHLQTAS